MTTLYLLGGGILILLAFFGSPVLQGGAIGGLIGGGLVAILGRYLIAPMLAKRHYKRYKAIHDEFTISQNDEGFHIESSNAKGFSPWSDIQKWRENNEYILIYPMPRLYHIVPKRLSQEGFDIDMLVNKLTENVGKPT